MAGSNPARAVAVTRHHADRSCGGDGTWRVRGGARWAQRSHSDHSTGTTNVSRVRDWGCHPPARAAGCSLVRRGPFRSERGRERTRQAPQLGVGFDGLLMADARRVKRALGFLGVVVSALRQGGDLRFSEMRVTGELETGETRSVVVTSAMVAERRETLGRPPRSPSWRDPATT